LNDLLVHEFYLTSRCVHFFQVIAKLEVSVTTHELIFDSTSSN